MPANMLSADTQAWEKFPGPEEIQSLAAFLQPEGHAVTFCYSLHSFPDRSHHTEAVAIGKLVQDQIAKFASGALPKALSKDLDMILAMTEEIQRTPARWRAVYTCGAQNILREFDLPAPESAARLNVAGHFFLSPLLGAMQSCRRYRVVLVESGKARLFEVRGTEIQEIVHSLPEGDLTRRSEDSRVGWSKHIDGNVEHQERAWFRMLVEKLGQLPGEHGPGTLVVGCRDDMRGELQPCFAGLEDSVIGWFHLPSFEMGAEQVLNEARPLFEQYEQERCRNLLHAIDEDHVHGVQGLNDVLKGLVARRVQTILVGDMRDQMVAECATCRQLQPKLTGRCASCGSSMLVPISADEALIRLALAQKTEILIFPHDEAKPFIGVAAMLRY